MAPPGQAEPRRRATIADVARRAGVSVGTVSNVLNARRPVSPERRGAVMAAVDALGYRPDGVARTLVARRQRPAAPAEGPRPRLIVAGYLSVDYVLLVDSVPRPGARVTAGEIRKMLGGPAANVAVFAAGLGGDCALDVDLVTRVGTDEESLWAVAALAERGVDAGLASCEAAGALSRCVVMVDGAGRRTIVNEPSPVSPDDLEAVLLGAVSGAPAAVHFDGFHAAAALRLAPALRAAGCQVSVHGAGLGACGVALANLLTACDLVVLDREALSALGQPSAAELQSGLDRRGGACTALAVTAGAGAARLFRPGRPPVVARPPLTQVVDTTGAGDAFAGLFLALTLSGLEAATALRLAVAGASLSTTALGAQGRVVDVADLGLAGAALAEEARG